MNNADFLDQMLTGKVAETAAANNARITSMAEAARAKRRDNAWRNYSAGSA